MSEYPKSWTQVPISEVLDFNDNGRPFQQGWSPQCHSYPAPEGAWGALKTTAIQHGQFWPHENKALPDHLEPRPHIEVKRGDILMTCAGPRSRCGVACLVEQTPPRLMMSGKMYRFRPDREVMHAKYLMYFLLTHSTTLKIDRMKTGISDSGLNLTHDRFATLEVPVAPPNEQLRIVTKIEELFSELEKGGEALDKAREQINIYRQSVLNYAFKGMFTSDSRAQMPTVTTFQAMTTQEIEDEGLVPLPRDWKYIRLWRLVNSDHSITYGVIKLGKDFPDGVPTLRSSDVRRLHLDLNAVKRISPKIAGDFQRTFLKGGEVLFTVRGTLGGVAVVPSTLAGWNISREVAMLAPAEMLDPAYLQYVLASPQLETWFKSRLRGVAYTGINLASLRDVPIAFCQLEEQRRIARKIAEQLSIVDAVETEIGEQLMRAELLRQAVLTCAFSGKLVTQNSADEPASALLERIRTERKDAALKKPLVKTKTRKNEKENPA